MGMTSSPSPWEPFLQRFDTYMAAARLAPRTRHLRVTYLRRLAQLNPDPYLVGAEELLVFQSNPRWSANTCKSAHDAICAFYRWAVDWDGLQVSPAVKLPAVSVPRGVPRPAGEQAIDDALAAATDRDRLMVALGAWAGLRRAEIAGVRWDDEIDGWLFVHGKGGVSREVPMAAELVVLWDAERSRRRAGRFGTGWRYRLDPASPFVFPGMKGEAMDPFTVGRVLSDALGGRYSAHQLRHRFATRFYEDSGDLLALQQTLGHSSVSTTQIYVLVSRKAKAAGVVRITGRAA
jgi:integrase